MPRRIDLTQAGPHIRAQPVGTPEAVFSGSSGQTDQPEDVQRKIRCRTAAIKSRQCVWDPEPWEWPCDLELSPDEPLLDEPLPVLVVLEVDESLEPDELPESDEVDDDPSDDPPDDGESDDPPDPLEPFEDLAVLEALVVARLSVL